MANFEYVRPDAVSLGRYNRRLRLENEALRRSVAILETAILEMNTVAQAGMQAIRESDKAKRSMELPEANPLNDSEVL